MDLQQAKSEATRVTVIGMLLDLSLGALKIVGGFWTQSFALITDGIHSLTDAVSDIFVLAVARVAHADADAQHQYGHGRFETMGTVGMGILFFTTAGVLIYDSLQRLGASDTPVPASAGVFIALTSIAGKEWIYQYTMRVAMRLNSSLLKANAWHSRSDAISSIAVLIGLVAALQGYPWMDVVAALFVALIIARVGWDLCADSLRELVDTAISPQRQQQLRQVILEVDNIRGVPAMRSRLSGGKLILELHLLVDPHISVSEGHHLGEAVRRALLGKFTDVGDVIVHIDPEPHETVPGTGVATEARPSRQEILDQIRSRWQELLSEDVIRRVQLHYLEPGIEIELVVSKDAVGEQLARQLESALADLDTITTLRIYADVHSARLRQTDA